MPNITRIPAQRVPVIEGPDNVMQREWYRFFNNSFTLLGLGQNQFTLEDLQVDPAAQTPQLVTTRYGYFYDTTTQTYHDLKAGAFSFTITPAGTNNNRFEVRCLVRQLQCCVTLFPIVTLRKLMMQT